MSQENYQEGMRNGDAFDRDLNPDDFAGRNVGLQGPHPEKAATRTAFDLKPVHRALDYLTDDELQQIPVLPEGSRLEQGASYVDLLGERREFRADGGMIVGRGMAVVPKSEVHYQMWNRLIGVDNPERTGDADDSATT
jgi:hypothetical protein